MKESFRNFAAIIALISTIIGVVFQYIFLIKLGAVEFFSWNQALNDTIGYWLIILVLFSLIFTFTWKSIKDKLWNIVLLFVILLLCVVFLPKTLSYSILLLGGFIDIIGLVFIFILIWKTYVDKSSSMKDLPWIIIVMLCYIGLSFFLLYTSWNNYINLFQKIVVINNKNYTDCPYQNDKFVFCKTGTGTLIFPIDNIDFFYKK